MREEQLVVHESELMRDQLTDILKEKLGQAAAVTRETTLDHARELLQREDRNWTLVVVSETARDNVRTRAARLGANSPACNFVRELRKDREIPVLGLGKVGSCHLKDLLQNWRQTAHANQDDFAGIAERAEALYTDRPLEPALELDWELSESKMSMWRMQSHGMNGVKAGPGAFTIERREIDKLLQASLQLMTSTPKDFRTWFDGVSAQIYDLLFDSRQNSELVKVFFRELGKVGSRNLRVSFKLSERWNRAMVEALRDGSDIRDSWILNSSMVRTFPVQKATGAENYGRPPLYTDRKRRDSKVNCLIINADPLYKKIDAGNWAGIYPALEKIGTECEDIATILAAAQGREIDEVRRLDLENLQLDVENTVIKTLGEKEWHIVHFAGHGVLGKNESPGLALSPRLGEVLPFEKLANALRATQFLFVSSCRSADPAFIDSAMSYSIPAVIGYRWPVDDADAAELSKAFYKALFTRGHTYKSLEQALLRARNEALAFNAAGNTWASPVLLTQTLAQAAA